MEIIRLLIENGVDVNAKDDDGDTALHKLCDNYQNENLIEIIVLLIQNKVDVNAKSEKYREHGGYTARKIISKRYNKENKDEILALLN